MRRLLAIAVLAVCALPASAQTADEIIAKYITTIGGMEELQAVTTLRRVGKSVGEMGFEVVVRQENKRPNLVRQEMTMQGLTGVTPYDRQGGWKIEPWGGKKDAEPLGEEELKAILEDADFDGPLVNYRQKGNKVEFVGVEAVDNTEADCARSLKSGRSSIRDPLIIGAECSGVPLLPVDGSVNGAKTRPSYLN